MSDLDELAEVDSANCPHCRAEIDSDELKIMAPLSDSAVLVCPDCHTMIGGTPGAGMIRDMGTLLLSEDPEDLSVVAEAMEEIISADRPSDVSDESIGILNDRMGSPERSAD